jgi:hypothetical protein
MSETDNPTVDREVALRDVFAGLGAVAKAGIEQGLEDTELIDLQADTTDRAREIYQQTTQE